MTTTKDLRKYLDAHGIDGPPTEPGWYVVSSVHGFESIAEIDSRGRLLVTGLEMDLNDPADITCHAPLVLALPAGRDLDAEVVAAVQASCDDLRGLAGKAST